MISNFETLTKGFISYTIYMPNNIAKIIYSSTLKNDTWTGKKCLLQVLTNTDNMLVSIDSNVNARTYLCDYFTTQ